MPSKAKQPGQAERRGMSALLHFFQIFQLCKSSCHSSRVSSTRERVPRLEMCIYDRTGSSNRPCQGQRPELLRCTSHKLAIPLLLLFLPGLPTSSFLPLLSHQESIFSSEHTLNSSMSLHLENSDGYILYHPHQLPCLAPSISTNHSSV